MKTHAKEIICYKCDYCNYESMCQSDVKRHEMTHLQGSCKCTEYEYFLHGEEILRQCKTCGILTRVDMNGHEEKIFKVLS